MLPSSSDYRLDDKKMIKRLEDIFKVFDDTDYVLIGGISISIYSYLNKDNYYLKRYTKDIDIAINEKYKDIIKEKVYKNFGGEKIEEKILFGYKGIKTEGNDYPSISILFKENYIPYNYLEFKINNKKIKLKVAKPEYLLVDKIFTYLRRKEEKDLEDIEELIYIMKKQGYDKEIIEDTFSKYSFKYPKYEEKAREFLNNLLYNKNS